MSFPSTNFLESNQKELSQLISRPAQADKLLEDLIQKLGENVSNPFYKNFCSQKSPLEKIDLLFGMVIEKGEQTCQEFIQVLEKVEELQPFWSKNKQESSRPTMYADNNSFVDNRSIKGGKAKDFTMKVELPAYQHILRDTGVRCELPNKDIVALNNSTVLANKFEDVDFDGNIDFSVNYFRGPSGSSVAMEKGCVASSPGSFVAMEKECVSSSSVKDKLGFFLNKHSDLVSKVKNVLPIVDDLKTNGYHPEMAANVKSEKTKQQQMRILLDSTTSTGAAEALFIALCKHEADLMKDLIGGRN